MAETAFFAIFGVLWKAGMGVVYRADCLMWELAECGSDVT